MPGRTASADAFMRRHELLVGAMARLRAAAAAPSPQLTVELAGLRTALDEHIARNEEPDGIFAEIERVAPRLLHAVAELREEHRALRERLGTLKDDSDPKLIRALLDDLEHHRRRSADVVYESTLDVGTED